MAFINISDADLKKSAQTYRKELLMMPVIAAQETLQHMTPRPGLAGRSTIGQISGNIELGPYDPNRVDHTGVTITPRTLETFLGSVVKRFDVNEAAYTVWGELMAQGQSLASADIARQVLSYLAAQLGKKLNMAIFGGERNAPGTTTAELFDGFDKITANEITATNISAANGNYVQLGSAITSSNAVDTLKSIYAAASDELQGQETKMFITRAIYRAYCDDYQQSVGSVPYNTEYKKTFLEGSDGLCELVPLTSKKNSEYIHLTTKGNMFYGYGAGLADENIAIEKYHEFLLSFVATMYFGVQFESVSPERLFVAELA